MQKIEINKKILIFLIQDCDLFTTLGRTEATSPFFGGFQQNCCEVRWFGGTSNIFSKHLK